MKAVTLHHKENLMVEIRHSQTTDLIGTLPIKDTAQVLSEAGYDYVTGSNGVWAKARAPSEPTRGRVDTTLIRRALLSSIAAVALLTSAGCANKDAGEIGMGALGAGGAVYGCSQLVKAAASQMVYVTIGCAVGGAVLGALTGNLLSDEPPTAPAAQTAAPVGAQGIPVQFAPPPTVNIYVNGTVTPASNCRQVLEDTWVGGVRQTVSHYECVQ